MHCSVCSKKCKGSAASGIYQTFNLVVQGVITQRAIWFGQLLRTVEQTLVVVERTTYIYYVYGILCETYAIWH